MKQITSFIDFVSPYAWLAFVRQAQVLEGLSFHMVYRPVLLGALLQQHANPGPAGIAPKREWTYRHVRWLSHHLGVALDMPLQHPFNPLPLLRMALQCSDDGSINRFTARTFFAHVWEGGRDALAPERMELLKGLLADQLHHGEDAQQQAKQWLRTNTEQAQQAGVFGVPAWEVDGRMFWGLDALPMLRAYLQGDTWFDAGGGDEQARLLVSGMTPL
jgi:2-hydroxychromene-2-carboxylate isomerase